MLPIGITYKHKCINTVSLYVVYCLCWHRQQTSKKTSELISNLIIDQLEHCSHTRSFFFLDYEAYGRLDSLIPMEFDKVIFKLALNNPIWIRLMSDFILALKESINDSAIF